MAEPQAKADPTKTPLGSEAKSALNIGVPSTGQGVSVVNGGSGFAKKEKPQSPAALLDHQHPFAQKIKDNREQEALLNQQHAGLSVQIAKGKQAQDELMAKAETDGAAQEQRTAQLALDGYRETRKNFPGTEFHPTPNNIQSLATIFGLTALIGESMGGQGQMSAMNALSSMNGMMQGWQQGRSDLWQREKLQHDAHMNTVKNIQEGAQKELELALKTAPSDRAKALAMAKEVAVKMGSDILKPMADRGEIDRMLKLVQSQGKDLVTMEKLKMQAIEQDRRQQETTHKVNKEQKQSAVADKEAIKLVTLTSLAKDMEKIRKEWKPEFTLGAVAGLGSELNEEMRRRIESQKGVEAAKWWGDYYRIIAKERHDMHGSALTKGETNIYNAYNIKSGDTAGLIKSRLDSQLEHYLKEKENSKIKLTAIGAKVPEINLPDVVLPLLEEPSSEGEDPNLEYRTNPNTGERESSPRMAAQ